MTLLATMRQNAYDLFSKLRKSHAVEQKSIQENSFLRKALSEEKLEGQRIAVIARTIALIVIAMLLPFLNPTWSVLYYEALLFLFVLIGILQWRVAKFGHSKLEVFLIMADLILITFIALAPNPFMDERWPTAVAYHFNVYMYFFVFLATATLAYSWRTVWAMGVWISVFWIIGLTIVAVFGLQLPTLTTSLKEAWTGNDLLSVIMDPNNLRVDRRFEEVVVILIVAGILALKSWRSNQLLMKQAGIAAERANLSRYFPPNMVDMLASSKHDPGAVRSQDIAVLFADIVGFTELSERHSPEEVMKALRKYHAEIEKAIFENHGTLDKYLGDGVMATFGTPQAGPDDALNALKAAKQITESMNSLNRDTPDGEMKFKVSVGLHYGPAILGDIGPQRRLEFAVVGDTVNVASRLEASTRKLGCNIVCSDALAQRIGNLDSMKDTVLAGFKRKSSLKLRGKEKPLAVWMG